MRSDNENRSVRIEVELDGVSAYDASTPATEHETPRGPIVVGLLAAVVLASAFFLLRPAQDQAADGTQRLAPTTTTIPAETTTTTTTIPFEEPPAILSALADAEAGGDIQPTRIQAARTLTQIVTTDSGFLALPSVLPSQSPQLLGSVDGLSWVEIETTRPQTPDAPELVEWFQLLPASSGFALVGSQATNSAVLEVATSEAGVLWQTVDGLGPIGDGERRVVPFAALEGSLLSFELSDEVRLEEVLRFDETNVDDGSLPSVCGAYSAGPAGFSLSECAEFSIVSGQTGDEVFDDSGQLPGPDELAGGPGLDNGGVSFAECFTLASETTVSGFDVLEFETPETDGLADRSFAFASNGLFPQVTSLANGRAAVVDGGTVGISSTCDAAGGELRREAGVVVLDFINGTASSFEAPVDLRSSISNGTPGSPIEVLGEFAVSANRSHLFINIDRSLWSVDTQTGVWSELFEASIPSVEPTRSRFALSDSETRLYRVAFGELEYVDLVAESDGSLGFRAAVSTITTNDRETELRFEQGFIRHATNDLVFYSDGLTIWRLQVPQ